MRDKWLTCAICLRAFVSAWSDEEAEAEALAEFGPDAMRHAGVVCDDCYARVVAWKREQEQEKP
jgi:hypothetical protein